MLIINITFTVKNFFFVIDQSLFDKFFWKALIYLYYPNNKRDLHSCKNIFTFGPCLYKLYKAYIDAWETVLLTR